jgi:hypothetical protein
MVLISLTKIVCATQELKTALYGLALLVLILSLVEFHKSKPYKHEKHSIPSSIYLQNWHPIQ